jgi:cytochrome c oxidase subunit 3
MVKVEKISVSVMVWLASELMFFSGIFAIYFTLRSTIGDTAWREMGSHLNFPYALIDTIILISSSVTCQLALYSDERGKWRRGDVLFTITTLLGTIFLAGQVYEYMSLIKDGIVISTDAWSSAFYLSTGIHWLHVLGGVVAFVLLKRKRILKISSLVESIVVSYYWHFVDVVWIVLFSTIYILR